jgi:structural maintenance of chromosome 3 (chondroitin sulfate proteoglycan 6)
MTLSFVAPSLDDAQGRLQLLYAKQGRSRQFSTQAERDAFLNKEIKSTKAAHAAQAGRAQEISGQIETARQDIEEAAERRQRHEEELDNLRETISSAAQKQDELKRSLETKIEQRK